MRWCGWLLLVALTAPRAGPARGAEEPEPPAPARDSIAGMTQEAHVVVLGEIREVFFPDKPAWRARARFTAREVLRGVLPRNEVEIYFPAPEEPEPDIALPLITRGNCLLFLRRADGRLHTLSPYYGALSTAGDNWPEDWRKGVTRGKEMLEQGAKKERTTIAGTMHLWQRAWNSKDWELALLCYHPRSVFRERVLPSESGQQKMRMDMAQFAGNVELALGAIKEDAGAARVTAKLIITRDDFVDIRVARMEFQQDGPYWLILNEGF